MPAVNMLQAKTNLSRLVERLELGTEREFVIARNGRPAARLIPFGHGSPDSPRLGIAKGLVVVPDDIDAHDDEVARLFQGCSVGSAT